MLRFGPSNLSQVASPEPADVRYLEFLRGAHERLRPATYLEVGVRTGTSMALSRTASIGIDPAPNVQEEIACEMSLFSTTSDEYFARPDPLQPFGGRPIDLSFIDGMHLFEYALRDFINVEKYSAWSSVVILDDMYPRNNDEAARDRHTRAWTGDVFQLHRVLRKYRPDLIAMGINTAPTGLLVVLGCDPKSTVLQDSYDAIVEECRAPDPQEVPRDILRRRDVLQPEDVLAAPFWDVLHDSRAQGVLGSKGAKLLRQSIEGSFGFPPAPSRIGRLKSLGRR